ncbi:hypothetical protein MFLAVUS_009547 [Mucor flavus]|uniref:Uncharacterized protein n=1 Tax=Mucor flavus TaxID=439312 RepID=A0ABP9ZA75_9FUNG
MNNNFYYEDGQGKILEEQGNDAVDWEEEVDPYNLCTLLTLSQYRAFQSRFPTEDIEELDVQIKELSKELSQGETSGKKIKLWKAAPSGRKANIEPRTAQIWA